MCKVGQPDRIGKIDMLPQFQHDCCHCEFLGRAEINLIKADIYFCNTSGFGKGSLIARLSDEPSNYISGDIEYVSPFNTWLCLAFAMYVRHLESNSANPKKLGGVYWKGNEIVLDIP